MQKFKLELDGKEIIVELKNLAEQASGSCLVRYGDTLVLATAVMSKYEREGIDFFPLTVDYEERFYAAGKILGSRYMRREGRPSEEAIITTRNIDRAIRPRFPNGLKKDVQVVVTCLSWDKENDPDLVGFIAASLALSISDIPWAGPLAALRVGQGNGKFVLNPIYSEREQNNMDLTITGIEEKEGILINMIEAEAKEIDEKTVSEAIEWAKPKLQKIIDFQKQIIKKAGKEKVSFEITQNPELEKEIKEFLGKNLEGAIYQKDKNDRTEKLNNLKEELLNFIEENHPEKKSYALNFFEKETEKIIHKNVIKLEKRVDGRKLDEIREINCEAGLLPRTHGSGLFSRGATKSLSILTLGAPDDQKLLEGMEIIGTKRFMHHYNFPPYCSGEVKPMRGPGRREIGHGMLAEKSLVPLMPDPDEFPYTIRIVTEILSSNGSTSMASVCSSSVALMDAGVPIKSLAAGIAIGIMMDKDGNYKILTDIQGPEDHYGDMDFKVAGTRKGITAIQMDVKIKGINEEILKKALDVAKKARFQILDKIEKVIKEPRPELSPYAPKIITLQINEEKIRDVIGPGGKIINEIIKETGAAIDIQQSGLIFITAEKEESGKKAEEWIKNLTREVKSGEVFQGKIKRILDFGAFAEILPNQEGLIHISELAPWRVEKVEDIVKIGDTVPVKVISVDEQGRINLSLKAVKKYDKRK